MRLQEEAGELGRVLVILLIYIYLKAPPPLLAVFAEPKKTNFHSHPARPTSLAPDPNLSRIVGFLTESLEVTVLHRELSQVVDVVSMLYILTHFMGFLIHVYIFIRHSCAESRSQPGRRLREHSALELSYDVNGIATTSVSLGICVRQSP